MQWQAETQRGDPAGRADLSVVSFVMPLSGATRRDNAGTTKDGFRALGPSRLMGEIFSQTMVREIVTDLMEKGILAVFADVTPLFNRSAIQGVGWASPWSALGTSPMRRAWAPSACTDFMITDRGCAHRLGSFVVNVRLLSGPASVPTTSTRTASITRAQSA